MKKLVEEGGGGGSISLNLLFAHGVTRASRAGKKRRLCLLLQEWSRWEDDCGRLSAMLDDVEAFISSGEPQASDEKLTEHRLDACQVNRLLFAFPTAVCAFTLFPRHLSVGKHTIKGLVCKIRRIQNKNCDIKDSHFKLIFSFPFIIPTTVACTPRRSTPSLLVCLDCPH